MMDYCFEVLTLCVAGMELWWSVKPNGMFYAVDCKATKLYTSQCICYIGQLTKRLK